VRNLLIFILLLIVIWWVRRALQKPLDDFRTGRRNRSAGSEPDLPEQMVACQHCGLHVPESEAVRHGDAVFCSEDHRRLGVRR